MVLYYCDLFFGLYPSSHPDDEGRAIPRKVVITKNRDDG
jgi:hypothetical protein